MFGSAPTGGGRHGPETTPQWWETQPAPCVQSASSFRWRCAITIPDLLAVARVVLVPVVMVLVRSADSLEHAYGYAAALFVVAALTDFFDGYLARRWDVTTTLGAFLDTTADKLLVTGTLFALVSVDRVSIWAAVIIVMREFIVMALRGLVAISGSFIAPSAWGKVKATVQFTAIGLAMLRLPEPWGPMYLDQWAMWVAVGVTIASGWQYVSVFMDTVRASRATIAK
ncbi:MAG: CDP-diacylglycerol--glycerol-3-phosphate 3-phosphatidyltransferase [Acidimicrobiia bacterium]